MKFVDLLKQDKDIRDKISQSMHEVLERGDFILGKEVSEFEHQIAKYLKVKHAIAVGSGTDALYISLKAFDFPAGSEVITTPFTFFATTQSIVNAGLKPIFIDIDGSTFNLDPNQIEQAITDKTVAILPVHLFGLAADMQQISAIAKKYKLKVIEDCAQAFGAKLEEQFAGSLGDCGCFSFYPTKNLGAYGDAGLISTNDEAIAEKALIIRNQGCRTSYHHTVIGTNGRCDSLQAAILLAKLPHINFNNNKRRRFAEIYQQRLANIPEVRLPIDNPPYHHVYHQYTIQVENRDELKQFLSTKEIPTMIYYDTPIHQQEIIKLLGYSINLLETNRCAKEVLSLPISPGLDEKEIQFVCDEICGFFAKRTSLI